MNRARLNHILIPSTFEGRERLRRSLLGRLLFPIGWIFGALTQEGRAAGLLLLFVGTAALDVVSTPIYLLWCALAGIVAGSLVARFALRVKALKVDVRVGEQVTVGQPLSMEVVLTNTGEKDVHALRVSGPFLPWDGRWLSAFPSTATLRASDSIRLSTRAVFIQRGQHHLDRFSVGALVPLGLALGPRVSSDSVRFMVVPRIAAVERLSLPQGAGQQQHNARSSAARIGDARELFGVRPYRAGDPLRDLHPRTWARTGKPHVREYVQTQNANVLVLVDCEAQGVSEQSYEALLSLTAGVIARLQLSDASVDTLSIGTDARAFARRRGAVLSESLNRLATAQQRSGVSDEALFDAIKPKLAKVAAVIVISVSPRDGLAELLRRRGCATKLLRVYHDHKVGLFRRTSSPPPSGNATMVPVSQIEQGRSLRL